LSVIALTDEAIQGFDTNYKINPPLRAQADVDALLEGIADGTLSILASDHAPHADFEKEVEFDAAPFGIVGLETALGLAVGVDVEVVADEALQGTLRHRHMLVRLSRMKVLGFSDADCRSQPHCHQRRMRIGSDCADLAVVATTSSTPFED